MRWCRTRRRTHCIIGDCLAACHIDIACVFHITRQREGCRITKSECVRRGDRSRKRCGGGRNCFPRLFLVGFPCRAGIGNDGLWLDNNRKPAVMGGRVEMLGRWVALRARVQLECFSVGVGMVAYAANHITWNGLLQAIDLRYWLFWRRNGKGSKGPWEVSGNIPLKLLLHVLWRRQ